MDGSFAPDDLKKSCRTCLLSLLWLALLTTPGRVLAEVHMPSIFSDHMVLMKARNVPVWGEAAAGEEVSVSIAEMTGKTKAASDGRWIIRFNLEGVGPGPYEIRVTGTNHIVISDVLVGAVWLASGQSNMEHKLKATLGAQEAIAGSANFALRVFKVDKVMKAEPAEDCKGHWAVADPATAGDFSAVAYYFGKRLQSTLGIPIGIVDASWSGTYSELWISREGIERSESLKTGEAARQKLIADFQSKNSVWVASFSAWLDANGRNDRRVADPAAYADGLSSEGWKTIELPGSISTSPGVFWIRKSIEVPAEVASPDQDFKVMIGPLNGFEQVYWNGVKVSEASFQSYPGEGYPRYFPIPPPLVRPGTNTIALRIYAPGVPPEISIDRAAFKAGPISLAGKWMMKEEFEFSPLITRDELEAMPKGPPRVSQLSASGIFNGVIHPLIPYAFAGVIWYQGESDVTRAAEYGVVFPLLIEDWREKWGQVDMPFYFCQLPRSGPKLSHPDESLWAELRESQTKALALPKTAEAVLIDMGESDDLHYREKKPVGERLAEIALREVYGRDVVDSGPIYKGMRIAGGKIEISFAHVNGGLSAHALPSTYDVSTLLGKVAPLIPNSPGSQLEGFAICGSDRHWVWANAKIINNDTVDVWADEIPHPVAVRYGWADDPTVNLFNDAGLPAAPFRTDSFPATTADKHFGAGT